MLPENRSFFIRGDDGGEYGPVDLDELREWVRENRAGLGTEVRLDEPNAIWHPWQAYPELVALLAEAHATGSAPVPDQADPIIAPIWKRILACVVGFATLARFWTVDLTMRKESNSSLAPNFPAIRSVRSNSGSTRVGFFVF